MIHLLAVDMPGLTKMPMTLGVELGGEAEPRWPVRPDMPFGQRDVRFGPQGDPLPGFHLQVQSELNQMQDRVQDTDRGPQVSGEHGEIIGKCEQPQAKMGKQTIRGDLVRDFADQRVKCQDVEGARDREALPHATGDG